MKYTVKVLVGERCTLGKQASIYEIKAKNGKGAILKLIANKFWSSTKEELKEAICNCIEKSYNEISDKEAFDFVNYEIDLEDSVICWIKDNTNKILYEFFDEEMLCNYEKIEDDFEW